jgi:hypothetical protein
MAVLPTFYDQASYEMERHVDTTGNSKNPAQYYNIGSVWGSGELH